ncbi:MAG: putative nucleotidyltransferase [Candidatus Kaiserbacteria bacterium GW2011_GWA2_52_12]|nr:MAG: putative nucleotidyltransferase [Candidatus Kaiserbacteria bacterium GW2011_GWA2_52_12]
MDLLRQAFTLPRAPRYVWYSIDMIDDLTTLAEKTRPIFKKYGFRKVGVFGSRSRGDNRADSDADFLFSDQGHPLSFLEKQEAEEELKSALGVDVDLVPDTKVVARMRPHIKRDLKIIYERQ